MPMNIQLSVITRSVPILYDMVRQGAYNEHELGRDIIIMASVGAGMNINAIVYKY